MLNDLGVTMELEVLTDAKAAICIASRKGLGPVRHIEVHYLRVQERVSRGDIILSKVWGYENPADLLIKFLDTKSMHRYMQLLGMKYKEGRADITPHLGYCDTACGSIMNSVSSRMRPQMSKLNNTKPNKQVSFRGAFEEQRVHQLLHRPLV